MARKSKDVLGIDELIKTFDKMESRFESKATAMLATSTRQAKKRAKQQTVKVTGNLRKAWKEKKPKEYQNGKYVVGMVYNDAPHGHLYEDGHRLIVRGREVGRVEGRKVLKKTMDEVNDRVLKDAEKILDEITKDVQ